MSNLYVLSLSHRHPKWMLTFQRSQLMRVQLFPFTPLMPLLSVQYDGLVNRTINFRISAENNLSTFNIQFLFFVCWQTKKSKLWMLLQQTFSNPDSLSIVLVFMSIIWTCQSFIRALSSKLFYFWFGRIKFGIVIVF